MSKKVTILLSAISMIALGLILINLQDDINQQQVGTGELPSFINEIRIINEERGWYNKAICLEINQEPFWIPANIVTHQAHLVDVIEVLIDDGVVPNFRVETSTFVEIHTFFDDSGNVLGWYPSPFTLCIDTSDFLVETHQVHLNITSTKGETFTYDWDFNMNNPYSEN